MLERGRRTLATTYPPGRIVSGTLGPTSSTRPKFSCPMTRKSSPGGAAPYSASLISLSVPSPPTRMTSTSTPRPSGTSSTLGAGRSARWMLPGLPGKTAIAFIENSSLRRDALLFDGSEQVVEGFRQRRMGEDGILEDRVGHLAHHGYLDHGGYLATLYPENRAAKDLVAVGVHDGLHHTPRLVHLQRPGHVAHRHLGHVDVAALLASLLLAQASATELRVYKDRVGHGAIGDRGVAAVEQVGADDAEVVVRDVGKGRTAL